MSNEDTNGKKQATPRRVPHITEIRCRDIPTAIESWRLAFEDDPLHRYMRDGKKLSRGWQIVENLYMRWFLFVWRRRNIMLVVEDGQSYVRATIPDPRKPISIIDSILEWTVPVVTWLLNSVRSAEVKKRRKEILAKLASASERLYGDRIKSMVHIDGLATSPRSQGRGHAGALLDAVTAKADAASRATYLESSNVANTRFYESHGFSTVGEIEYGGDNPSWKEPPVVVKLMVREYIEEF
ncbi:N-acetyltransferase domain-containing protein [Pleurotus pulmonarius]